MNRIYVLYDGDCGLCASVREWAQQQAQMVPMVFVAANSPQASVLFPSLSRPGQRPEELIVVDEQGGVYREGHAWIMCLYALAEYRELSLRLASPALLPLARKAFSFLSKRRGHVSGGDQDVALLVDGLVGVVKCPIYVADLDANLRELPIVHQDQIQPRKILIVLDRLDHQVIRHQPGVRLHGEGAHRLGHLVG